MSTFKDFLAEATSKTYAYRIKIAADCSSEHTTVLENALQKYQLESVTAWKRTPIQQNPPEFVARKNARFTTEVCDADIVLKYPVNERILEVWIAVNLNVDLDRVICYGIKEARKTNIEASAARIEKDRGREVSQDDSVLSDDSGQDFEHYTDHMGEYPFEGMEDSVLFGEEYNEKFLAELKKVKEEKGADYFRNYPTKEELMGDNMWSLWDTLHNEPNMGKGDGPNGAKEVSVNDQNLRH